MKFVIGLLTSCHVPSPVAEKEPGKSALNISNCVEGCSRVESGEGEGNLRIFVLFLEYFLNTQLLFIIAGVTRHGQSAPVSAAAAAQTAAAAASTSASPPGASTAAATSPAGASARPVCTK